jgi:Tol biopolymer transport system component
MLTTRGENAEAYWSFDGRRLVYQARRGDEGCDRIRTMRPDGSRDVPVATSGAHTCAFFLPGDKRILWASTRSGGPECPPKPDHSQGYVWAVHEEYEIYSSWADGTGVRQLTHSPGYDAEATVAPDGTVVFTSARDGDLDIYTMDSDGRNVRRLTYEPGYDGGPFFSPDGSLIAYRAAHPGTEAGLADFRALLSKGLVRPSHLDLWVMSRDGSNKRRVTDLPGASFAPSFLPGNEAVIFSTNHADPKGRDFDLHLVRLDGTGAERVTWNDTFDGFPMFSPDGRRLVFCSNRGNLRPGETNVFVADWVDRP